MRVILIVAAALLITLSTVILPARAAFIKLPTFDITTSSSCTGATDAIYKWHGENPDIAENVDLSSVTIPAGYSGNPLYWTTTPGIVVMTGIVGDIGSSHAVAISAKTTTQSGTFLVSLNGTVDHQTGMSMWIGGYPPIQTRHGNLGPFLWFLRSGKYVDFTFVAGFLINPSSPGVYTWGPNDAAPVDSGQTGPTVPVNPRPGFTNQVQIVKCPEGSPFVGIAFVVVGIGGGAVAAAVGLAVAMSGQRGSEVTVYGGYYYCRKHRVPLWYVNGGPWCPIERRPLRTS